MTDARREYFDSIAEKWDGWMDMSRINDRLEKGLTHFDLGPDESVLDVGCGTGNLTRVLLARLGAHGRVIAVDPAARMLELARAKNDDPRVELRQAQARELGLAPGSLDRVICFSVWPHIDSPEATARELGRVLKPNGWLHVWHIDSRATINQVHADAGEAVRGDVLVPASDLSALLATVGFIVEEEVDSGDEYLVSARKAPQG